jgi:flagellar biogenesis protein FliO
MLTAPAVAAAGYARTMKRLIVLLALIGLVAVAVKKLQQS